MREALLAEYADPAALLRGITQMWERGHRRVEAYTPYAGDELRQALHRRRSRLPIAIFVGGMTGALLAYGLQWLLVAYLYPLNVGGRPPHMPLAFVIITFEMGVLAAAFTAFFGVLFRAKLLRLYHPIFEVDGIERAGVDTHWLRLDIVRGDVTLDRARRDLEATQPLRIVHHEARP